MALNNPSSLFTAGAVKLDSTPSVNLYAQLLQRKQAKQDALDQYYQKALTDVTPTGMRNKDVLGGWAEKLKNWQAYAMNPENKKHLLNPRQDNYKTVTEFNRMYSDLMADTERSKQELADEKMLNAQKISGKWNIKDKDMDIVHRKGLSIYDKARLDANGSEPDLSAISFNVPEFTPLQQTQLQKAASQGLKMGKKYDESKTRVDDAGLKFIPYTEGYSPEQVKVYADNYGNMATQGALDHYEDLMHDPTFFNVANKAYQSVYGETTPDGKPNLVDTPKKAAQADAVIKAQAETKSGEEKTADPSRRENFAKLMANDRFEKSKVLIALNNQYRDLRDEKKKAAIIGDVDAFLDDQVANADTNETVFGGKEKILKVSPVVLESFRKKDEDGVHYISPTGVKLLENGNYLLTGDGFYNEIPRAEYKAGIVNKVLNTTTKISQVDQTPKQPQANKPVTSTNSSYKIKGKTYSEKELLKLGYTADQIKPFKL